jgi:hypothetical protein
MLVINRLFSGLVMLLIKRGQKLRRKHRIKPASGILLLGKLPRLNAFKSG